MRLTPLDRLHDALRRRLPDNMANLELVGPVRPPKLDALRRHVMQLTGEEVPALVEALLLAHDGSMYQPISPSRPDTLLGAEDIISMMQSPTRVIPVIDRNVVDEESGQTLKWAIDLTRPEGPMWENVSWREEEGVGWEASGPTPIGWLEAVLREVEQFQPPAPLVIGTALARWSASGAPAIEQLEGAPLGRAYLAMNAGRRPSATLVVKLDSTLWGEAMDFQSADNPFPDLCRMTARLLRRRAQRSESLWALSPQQVQRLLMRSRVEEIQVAELEVATV